MLASAFGQLNHVNDESMRDLFNIAIYSMRNITRRYVGRWNNGTWSKHKTIHYYLFAVQLWQRVNVGRTPEDSLFHHGVSALPDLYNNSIAVQQMAHTAYSRQSAPIFNGICKFAVSGSYKRHEDMSHIYVTHKKQRWLVKEK